MSESPFTKLPAYVADAYQCVVIARETACEAAIQSGGLGVLETWHADGSVSFTLSTKVPYGHIYEVRELSNDATRR